MKRSRRWGPPGWPWELELLALVFVITAIAVPSYLHYMQTPEPAQMSLLAQAQMARQQNTSSWQDLQGFFWAVVIVGLYLVHIAMGSASIDFMSTPFTHLFAPLVFSMITYYRLFQLSKTGPTGSVSIVSGSPVEIVIWVAGVMIITYLVARIRMARLMLGFKDVDWDISTPSQFDRSYAELTMQIRPLIYPPRVLRACPMGILVEGWFYAMPIPFDSLHAIDAVQGQVFVSQGYCLATSTRSLVRLQIAEKAEPILLSPKDRNAFVRYCQQQLSMRGPPVSLRASETGRGTRPGTAAGRGTRASAGTTKGDPNRGTRAGVIRHAGTTDHGVRPADSTAGRMPEKIAPEKSASTDKPAGTSQAE